MEVDSWDAIEQESQRLGAAVRGRYTPAPLLQRALPLAVTVVSMAATLHKLRAPAAHQAQRRLRTDQLAAHTAPLFSFAAVAWCSFFGASLGPVPQCGPEPAIHTAPPPAGQLHGAPPAPHAARHPGGGEAGAQHGRPRLHDRRAHGSRRPAQRHRQHGRPHTAPRRLPRQRWRFRRRGGAGCCHERR